MIEQDLSKYTQAPFILGAHQPVRLLQKKYAEQMQKTVRAINQNLISVAYQLVEFKENPTNNSYFAKMNSKLETIHDHFRKLHVLLANPHNLQQNILADLQKMNTKIAEAQQKIIDAKQYHQSMSKVYGEYKQDFQMDNKMEQNIQGAARDIFEAITLKKECFKNCRNEAVWYGYELRKISHLINTLNEQLESNEISVVEKLCKTKEFCNKIPDIKKALEKKISEQKESECIKKINAFYQKITTILTDETKPDQTIVTIKKEILSFKDYFTSLHNKVIKDDKTPAFIIQGLSSHEHSSLMQDSKENGIWLGLEISQTILSAGSLLESLRDPLIEYGKNIHNEAQKKVLEGTINDILQRADVPEEFKTNLTVFLNIMPRSSFGGFKERIGNIFGLRSLRDIGNKFFSIYGNVASHSAMLLGQICGFTGRNIKDSISRFSQELEKYEHDQLTRDDFVALMNVLSLEEEHYHENQLNDLSQIPVEGNLLGHFLNQQAHYQETIDNDQVIENLKNNQVIKKQLDFWGKVIDDEVKKTKEFCSMLDISESTLQGNVTKYELFLKTQQQQKWLYNFAKAKLQSSQDLPSAQTLKDLAPQAEKRADLANKLSINLYQHEWHAIIQGKETSLQHLRSYQEKFPKNIFFKINFFLRDKIGFYLRRGKLYQLTKDIKETENNLQEYIKTLRTAQLSNFKACNGLDYLCKQINAWKAVDTYLLTQKED